MTSPGIRKIHPGMTGKMSPNTPITTSETPMVVRMILRKDGSLPRL